MRPYYILFFLITLCFGSVSCNKDEDNNYIQKEAESNNNNQSNNNNDKDDSIIHEAVDLGLPSGNKWATMNLYAKNIDEDGNKLFAWGETIGYEKYDFDKKHSFDIYSYKWYDEPYYTKYVTYNQYFDFGSIDNITTLSLTDDAAHKLWGSSWRIPTINDIMELLDNTTNEWIGEYGKKYGVKLTSKINGKSIFLPTTGYRDEFETNGILTGDYWSSSLVEEAAPYAYGMYFAEKETIHHGLSYRYNGMAIRPVLNTTGKINTYGDVVSDDVKNITYSSATVYGHLFKASDMNSQKGIIYGTTNNIEKLVSNGKRIVGSYYDDNHYKFSATIEGLQPSTTYYYIAFAGNKIAYNVKSFKTGAVSLTAVDLDLPSGTKWANINIGAKKPEDFGLYFAWGETTGYDINDSDYHSFNWASYKWADGTMNTLTKYNSSSKRGEVDNKSTLELSDDAAYKNLGGSWRMPTKEDIEELLNNTYINFAYYNDVKGVIITSKTNRDKSIFIPYAGYMNDKKHSTNFTNLWSSSLKESSPSYAIAFRFIIFSDTALETGYSCSVSSTSSSRCMGFPIRPVSKK